MVFNLLVPHMIKITKTTQVDQNLLLLNQLIFMSQLYLLINASLNPHQCVCMCVMIIIIEIHKCLKHRE